MVCLGTFWNDSNGLKLIMSESLPNLADDTHDHQSSIMVEYIYIYIYIIHNIFTLTLHHHHAMTLTSVH